MEKFIISYRAKVNGVWGNYYHEKMELNTDLTAINVYKESITPEKRKALRFYLLDEAQKVANLFGCEVHQISTVIRVSK